MFTFFIASIFSLRNVIFRRNSDCYREVRVFIKKINIFGSCKELFLKRLFVHKLYSLNKPFQLEEFIDKNRKLFHKIQYFFVSNVFN